MCDIIIVLINAFSRKAIRKKIVAVNGAAAAASCFKREL
jgi:hypothetical protein